LRHLAHDREVRQPQHETRTELLVDAEELELSAEHAVIAAFDLLESGEIGVELLLVGPDGAVDALQLRIALIAPPVRAGDRQQLERPDVAGPRHVRALAEIHEAVVLINAHAPVLDLVVAVLVRALLRELLDLVDLVVLFALAEEPQRFRHRHLAALERRVVLHDLPHLRFDRAKVIGREGPRQVEVVVEAVPDGWSETELRARKELQHRAGHDMRGRMPQRVQRFVAVVGLPFRLRHAILPVGTKKAPSSRLFGTRGAAPAVPPEFPTRSLRLTGPCPWGSRFGLYGAHPRRSAVVSASVAGPAHTFPGSLEATLLRRCPRRREAAA
jgi:hypothetical protein